MKLEEIRDKIGADSISRKDGVITVRQGFFYRHGRSEEDLVKCVMEAFPNAEILDKGEHWTSFRGGAPLNQQSHWYVKFKLE